MNYDNLSLEDMLIRARSWYESPEGQIKTASAWKTAQNASKNLKEDTIIKPDHLKMVIGL